MVFFVPCVGEVLVDWYVVYPRPQASIVKLHPFLANVQYQRATEEQVPVTKTSSHTTKVK